MVILYTSDKNPITELVDSKLQDLGLLIYNESKKGNNVEELLGKFITLSLEPENNMDDVDLKRYGLKEVRDNDVLIIMAITRKVPILNYVFDYDVLNDVLKKDGSSIIHFISFLREVFHIKGGLRFNHYLNPKNELYVILDFTEYKCNEVYKETFKLFSNETNDVELL